MRERDATQPTSLIQARIRQRFTKDGFHLLSAGSLSQALFGDTVTAHTLMLGYAWQQGRANGELARQVAISAYRLMAYKDEYEVARLYASPEFQAGLAAQFSGTRKVSLWLAPPLISRVDPATARPRKRKFGPWIFSALRVLAGMKRLRGTRWDPFGYTAERRMERQLVRECEAQVRALCAGLDSASYAGALELARLPQDIRGFGPV